MLARTTDGINAPTTIKPKIDVDSVNNFKLFSIVVINFVPEVYPALKSGILNIFNATLTAIQSHVSCDRTKDRPRDHYKQTIP